VRVDRGIDGWERAGLYVEYMLESARPKRWGSAGTDALVAIALFAIAEVEVGLAGLGPSSALAAAAATLPLAFRRRAPVLTVLIVVWVIVLGNDWADNTNAGFLVLLLASYSVGAHASRTRALVGAAVLIAVIAGAVLLEGNGGDFWFVLFMVGMPWLAGRVVRRYRERAERLEELAEQLATERDVRAQLAVAEERQRMAAELHDAVGHAVSTMVVQAGAAGEMLADSPERALPALSAVQRTGRDAIRELRVTLGVLRDSHERVPPAPRQDPIREAEPGSRRRLAWSPGADVVVAVFALALGVAYALVDDAMVGVRFPVALVQVPAAAAIAVRSRWPFVALLLALGAMAGESALIGGDPEAPTSLVATLLAVYSVAAHFDRRRAAFAGALGVAVPCVVEVTADNGDVYDLWVIVPVFAVPWLAGRMVRASRRQGDRLRTLTERLERERDARVRLALIEERTRIARELHDSIAHAVSVMVLQAGAAEQVLATAPDRAREAAKAIEELGRQALGELRRMLGVLGADEPVGVLAPPVGLGHLDSLIAHVRQAGLPVRLQVHGVPARLPGGVEISAYRIIQEGLTNTLKHAGKVPTTVTLDYGRDILEVEIVDSGGGPREASLDGPGQGLIGMRERVALYGGTLDAGRGADGGYVVRARLNFEQTGPVEYAAP
jgi:signal transduction histidine kinase